ncbi:DUF4465 domain-containing protein [Labilibacter sediminis]|nr:DUF4465 domain-containing protein [Labilibacter sediminis]
MMNIKSTPLYFLFIAIGILLFSCEEHVKDIPPSEIFINMPEDGYEVRVTDTLVISPKITYDINSTYTWTVDGKVIWNEKDYTLIPDELNLFDAVFMVKNDRGSDEISIWAQSMYLTDFEDLELENDSFWVNNEANTYFTSDSLKFEINGSYSAESWTGFTYSNMTGSNSEEEYEKYSAYKQSASFDSEIFGVMMQDDIQTSLIIETIDGEDHVFKSFAVNNSYYVYDAIKSGNHGSKIFGGEDGTDLDSLVLNIKGYTKNGLQSGTIQFYLANYTFGNNRDNYIITDWSTIDLQDLGAINRIELEISSSDVVDGKMMTPGFVCIDEFKIIE